MFNFQGKKELTVLVSILISIKQQINDVYYFDGHLTSYPNSHVFPLFSPAKPKH